MTERFKTTRMTDATPANTIDSEVQDLEDAITYFFGLPVDQDLLGQVFTADQQGRITARPRIRAAANVAGDAGAGLRCCDTTSGSEFFVVAEDGYLSIYRNAGSESSPNWLIANKLDLLTGVWQYGAVGSFIGLSDTPASYAGKGLQVVRVNSGETALEFSPAASGGATTFLGLTDTPSSYVGQALKMVRVNSGATGLEFTSSVTSTFLGLSDTFSSYGGLKHHFVQVNSAETALIGGAVCAGGVGDYIPYTQDPVTNQVPLVESNIYCDGDGMRFPNGGAISFKDSGGVGRHTHRIVSDFATLGDETGNLNGSRVMGDAASRYLEIATSLLAHGMGILLENTYALSAKDAGGMGRPLAMVDASSQAIFGGSGIVSYLTGQSCHVKVSSDGAWLLKNGYYNKWSGYYAQVAQPSLGPAEFAFWKDTGTDKYYLVFASKKVELT